MSSTREKLERLFPKTQRNTLPRPRPDEPSPPRGPEALRRLEKELLGDDASMESSLSLRERLERLVAVTASRPRSPARSLVADREPAPLQEVLGGEEFSNENGSFYRVDRVYPFAHHHGRTSLGRLREVPRQAFSILARGESSEIDLERALFLDTETTGLAGGSGTYAFLIGLGFVQDDAFVVRQLFMRDYREEPSMLRAVGELISDYDVLVSYNGKSFDVPLLETRFVLARQSFSFEETLHFDLLHPARSLWKARFESCRLAELEYLLLGLERENDVPGHRIPEIYFHYVRSGDASGLPYVFEHNCHDILSLAALTVCASDMLDEESVPIDPLDDFSLGRLFERAAQPERSMMHYRRAVEAGVGGAARRRSLKALAEQFKRRGEWEEARRLWEELASETSTEGVQAAHELAMLFEHRERDLERALAFCDDALSRLREGFDLPLGFRVRWRDRLEHRRRRLVRRLASTAG